MSVTIFDRLRYATDEGPVLPLPEPPTEDRAYGACVDCPRDPCGHPRPEYCLYRYRYDHCQRWPDGKAWTSPEAEEAEDRLRAAGGGGLL